MVKLQQLSISYQTVVLVLFCQLSQLPTTTRQGQERKFASPLDACRFATPRRYMSRQITGRRFWIILFIPYINTGPR